ncbi:hypothetical protein ACFSL6_12640 [Paenibacillus thailandensis]|uniref:DUF559 domain-containing protein n=1 Tax=Paenibacillus thailandensis TaxID=393250 RepID=A0ABW5R124_9BACL
MGFQEVHEAWLAEHLRKRSGERRSRLERGHGHGERLFLERVWWPMFSSFSGLHPEYEVTDWRGRPFYIDLAWFQGQRAFAFEIKGYGPHVQNTDRTRYSRELNRETYLQLLGFQVISIPYDDLAERPNLILSLLKPLLAPYLPFTGKPRYDLMEREVLLLGLRRNKPLRPVDLVCSFGINRRTAVKLLQTLSNKGKFRPKAAGISGRIMSYELVRSLEDLWII